MALNSSRFIDYDIDKRFSFDKEESYIVTDYEQNVYKSYEKNGSEDSIFNFCSETNKYVVCLSLSFFHFYTESFATLILLHQKDPSLEVVIVDIIFEGNNFLSDAVKRNEIKMFFLFLIDNNIKYTLVNVKNINNTKINNAFFANFNANDSRDQANLLSKMSMPYVEKQPKQNKAYIKTNRVKNENVLINYLSSLGFDIIDNKHFNSFIDQMTYYYNCKVLVAATSGGLVNSSFVDNGGLILELVTPVPHSNEEGDFWEEVHHIYDTLSLQRNHVYVGLSNVNKTAEDIIEQINNNKFLKLALEQN